MTFKNGILVLSLAFFIGCKQQSINYPQSLVIFPGAKNVKHQKYQGTDQVSYQVDIDYPAKDVIDFVASKLKEDGCFPLKEDYLNPGTPSSHVRGWASFLDSTKGPTQLVDQWLAQWQKISGEVVWFAFRYSWPQEKQPDRKHLSVSGIYCPAELAKLQKETVLKNSSTSNEKPKAP